LLLCGSGVFRAASRPARCRRGKAHGFDPLQQIDNILAQRESVRQPASLKCFQNVGAPVKLTSCQLECLQQALTRELCWPTRRWQPCLTGKDGSCHIPTLQNCILYARLHSSHANCIHADSRQQRQPGTRKRHSTGMKLKSKRKKQISCSLSMRNCRYPTVTWICETGIMLLSASIDQWLHNFPCACRQHIGISPLSSRP